MAERKLVRDLMTVGVATCPPDAKLEAIARFMLEKDLESLVVLDQEGHAIGIVSQDEVIKAYAYEDWRQLKAEDIMRDKVPQLPPDIPLTAAAQIMRDQRVRAVFLMHHAGGITYPAAVLTYRHLMRLIAAQDDSELADLGIKSARQAPLETFIEKREAARRRAGFYDEE